MRTKQGRGVLTALLLGLFVGTGGERSPEPVATGPDRLRPESDREASVSGTARAGLRLVINTSSRKLYVYENGERTRTYTVAVGQSGHRTPMGTYSISKVVWNPWWRPPARGWTRGKKDTPPGPNNPMGRVKMYFRDLYYIHGTPNEGSLGQAVSHGCVRMSNSNAIELARLVHDYGGGASGAQIDRLLANSKRTRTIWLDRKIPVEIVSGSAMVEDGRLRLSAAAGSFAGDVMLSESLQALRAAGFDLASLDRERLRDLVALSRRGPVSARLEELVAPEPAHASVRAR